MEEQGKRSSLLETTVETGDQSRMTVAHQQGGCRIKTRIIAWLDIICTAFKLILFVSAIGIIMRMYMNSRISIAPDKTGGVMLAIILCMLFLAIEIWMDFGLLKATNPECDRLVALEHAKYWRGFNISQLVITLLLIFNSSVYRFSGSFVVLTFSLLALILRVIFIVIVHKFIEEMRGCQSGLMAVAPEQPDNVLKAIVRTPTSLICPVDTKTTVNLAQKNYKKSRSQD